MDSFVVAVETRDSLPTLKQLIAKILDEERRQSEKTNEDETVLAVTSWNERQNENTNTQRQNKKKMIKCYACGKRGHIRAQCRKQKAECNSTHVVFNVSDTTANIKSNWILDSGATSHMVRDKKFFVSIRECKENILLASGQTVNASGIGNVKINVNKREIELKNVLFVPNLHSNFISVAKILKKGYEINFAKNYANVISNHNKIIFAAKENRGTFCVNALETKETERVNAIANEKDSIVWHKRFEHLNAKDLTKLANRYMVRGLNLKMPTDFKCSTCATCKISGKPYCTKNNISTKSELELIHTDIYLWAYKSGITERKSVFYNFY